MMCYTLASILAHGLNTSSMQSNNKTGFSTVGFLNKLTQLHKGQDNPLCYISMEAQQIFLRLKIGATGVYNQQL